MPELLELSAKTGIDRVPVMTEDGSALGLVNVFDVLLDSISTARAGSLCATHRFRGGNRIRLPHHSPAARRPAHACGCL